MLEVVGLQVAYGRSPAVRGVSISISERTACIVLGANGAGKTSVLRGISGFERWEPGRVVGGRVTFRGQEIQGWSPGKVARTGLRLVPERQSVFLPLTVSENLRIAIAEGRRRAGFTEMYDLVGSLFPVLSRRRNQPAGLLSGGERQMLGISLRLLTLPSCLLVDEISFGLAPGIVREIFRALGSIKERSGLTMLIVEQNIDAALSIADDVYVMQGGGIVAHGSAETMRDNRLLFQQYVGTGVQAHTLS